MRDNDLGGGLVFFTACLDGEDDRGTVQSTLFVYLSGDNGIGIYAIPSTSPSNQFL